MYEWLDILVQWSFEKNKMNNNKNSAWLFLLSRSLACYNKFLKTFSFEVHSSCFIFFLSFCFTTQSIMFKLNCVHIFFLLHSLSLTLSLYLLLCLPSSWYYFVFFLLVTTPLIVTVLIVWVTETVFLRQFKAVLQHGLNKGDLKE